jgi:hypothetical protein
MIYGFISLINMLESYDLQTLIDDKLTSFIFYVDLFILIKCSDIILIISSLLIGNSNFIIFYLKFSNYFYISLLGSICYGFYLIILKLK